ncbi:MAG: hypothetical protein ACTSX7_15625 [Alphaproteobacteria bacterium]
MPLGNIRILVIAAIVLLAVPVLLAAPALLAASAQAQELDVIEPFMGTYVGSGVGTRQGKPDEQRDMDVTIKPYKNGFTVSWITVIRGPSGERAGADVKRREIEENFVPSDDIEDVYIRAPEGTLFKKAELPNPLRGEPMRWASIHNATMTIYSLGITAEGGSELQIYHRTLTDSGIEANFLRMKDEKVMLRVTGELTRVQ